VEKQSNRRKVLPLQADPWGGGGEEWQFFCDLHVRDDEGGQSLRGQLYVQHKWELS